GRLPCAARRAQAPRRRICARRSRRGALPAARRAPRGTVLRPRAGGVPGVRRKLPRPVAAEERSARGRPGRARLRELVPRRVHRARTRRAARDDRRLARAPAPLRDDRADRLRPALPPRLRAGAGARSPAVAAGDPVGRPVLPRMGSRLAAARRGARPRRAHVPLARGGVDARDDRGAAPGTTRARRAGRARGRRGRAPERAVGGGRRAADLLPAVRAPRRAAPLAARTRTRELLIRKRESAWPRRARASTRTGWAAAR